MNGDYLEPEYKPAFEAWKSNQTPQGNAEFLKAIRPVVDKGIQMYGDDSPLARSQGKLLALEAMQKYDPGRSRLQSHLLNQMQGLRRISQQQHNVLKVPERILLESQKLKKYQQELEDELGRPASDAELADKLGVNPSRLSKIRSYQPGMTSGQAEVADPVGGGYSGYIPGKQNEASDLWLQIVYQDLNPTDQQILEYTLGLNGRPKLSNQELAKKLGRSPGAISQRKIKIQKLLDQEQELSPFIVD
jgi:DNA-directed RNA polymerase sigma subunit (sigma70/sigma32)